MALTQVQSQMLTGNSSTNATNTALGSGALNANPSGTYNTALGYQAGYGLTTAGSCVALGYKSLYTASTTGNVDGSIAIGQNAARDTTTGLTLAIGNGAGILTTTGDQNTIVGHGAMYYNVTGSNNTAVGRQALVNSGSNVNTAIGYQAGYNLATGANCVFIGYYTQTSGSGDSQSMVISTNSGGAVGKGSNTGYIAPNGGGMYQGNNSSSWATTSDQRLKKNIVDNNVGLEIISQIQVRNFEYRLPEEVTELDANCAIEKEGVQLGVIAQEIQQVSEEFVTQESTGVLSVDPDNITWYLVNAVKQLNAKVEAQAAEIEALKAPK